MHLNEYQQLHNYIPNHLAFCPLATPGEYNFATLQYNWGNPSLTTKPLVTRVKKNKQTNKRN
jgi:hypothetical protein